MSGDGDKPGDAPHVVLLPAGDPRAKAILDESVRIGNRIFQLLTEDGIGPSREVAMAMLMSSATLFRSVGHNKATYLVTADMCWDNSAIIPKGVADA